ncbi:hypothetical protein A2U01_0046017, partial [Trifolium medium]|nr:hypothetical protein [Trifolium medium]
MIQTIVQELILEHKDQDFDKTSPPQNAGEHQSYSKQPSPPQTNETPRETVDKKEEEKPAHTSPNKPTTSQEKVDDEMNAGLKQDKHQFNPEVTVQVLVSHNIETGQIDPQGPTLVKVQGGDLNDQVLEDVNAVANNNDVKAEGGGDQPLDGEHSTTNNHHQQNHEEDNEEPVMDTDEFL